MLWTVKKYIQRGRRIIKRLSRPDRFVAIQHPRLHIETTNICNADCVYCANSAMTRKKMALDMDCFKKSVDQFAAMGGTFITFNVTIGDPLLDKKIIERGRYVRSFPQFKSLGFVTTLQWLHRHNIEDFLKVFTWVSVSTVLSGREKYREFFGVDKYDQMLRNLDALTDTIPKYNPAFAFALDVKPTDEPIEQVLAHPDFQRINAKVGQDLVANVRGRAIHVDDWTGAVKLPSYLKKRPLIPRWRRPCRMLYDILHVHSNGNVSACACRDYNADSELVIGNAATDNLSDLWTGDRLRLLRENWRTKNKVPDICKTCTFYQI